MDDKKYITFKDALKETVQVWSETFRQFPFKDAVIWLGFGGVVLLVLGPIVAIDYALWSQTGSGFLTIFLIEGWAFIWLFFSGGVVARWVGEL